MDVTVNQLRVFQEVARQRQVTRAAGALFVSQPAVSKSLKDLERQVGMPLFEALGRRLQLTEAGTVVLALADRVLADLAETDRSLAALRGGEEGRLVIGASSTPGTYLLPGLLGDFRRVHPQVEVFLQIGDTREVLERVSNGALDVGVVGEVPFPPTLRADLFRLDRLVLILWPSHPLSRKKRVTLSDLANEPFVLREPGSNTRATLERSLRERGFEPRVGLELGSTEAIKKSVGAGLGVSFVSEHAVALEQRAGALITRAVPDLTLDRGLYIVRRASLRLSSLHQRLLAALSAAEAPSEPTA
jgi:DNA-binding transcriptional LysR family regulator